MAQSSTPGVTPKGGGQVLMALIIFVILFVVGWFWTKQTQPSASGTMADGYHHFTIYERNFYYEPDHMTWHVGEKVELTIMDRSKSRPGLNHQWNMGRDVATDSTGFTQHREPTGWQTNFFAGVTINTKSGTEQIQKDFSVSLTPGQHFTFKFTVPNKVGKWTYACFLQNGQHFLDGMHGEVNVVPASGA